MDFIFSYERLAFFAPNARVAMCARNPCIRKEDKCANYCFPRGPFSLDDHRNKRACDYVAQTLRFSLGDMEVLCKHSSRLSSSKQSLGRVFPVKWIWLFTGSQSSKPEHSALRQLPRVALLTVLSSKGAVSKLLPLTCSAPSSLVEANELGNIWNKTSWPWHQGQNLSEKAKPRSPPQAESLSSE